LEQLDTINWTLARHAFGPATNIPTLLHLLVSQNAEECLHAIEKLTDYIHHQGTVYDAALAVAPFLIALLRDPNTPDKEHIVATLARLTHDKASIGHSEEEVRLVQAIRALLGQDLHILYPYLAAKEVTVRWITAYTLAFYPDHRATTLPLLQRAFAAETHADAKRDMGKVIAKLQVLEGAK
jgi:hypothetical protein